MTPVAATRAWVDNFVLHHGLCPFAARPFRAGLVGFVELAGEDPEAVFFGAWAQVQALVSVPAAERETTLLVIPAALPDFPLFLDFVAALEEGLAETGADQLVQLAHFHPDYVFAGVAPDDPGNRTNRSPLPVVQLLRTDSVAAAVAAYGDDVHAIPERNVALLRSLPTPE